MAIIGLTGARGSGRTAAAAALGLMGYERAGFRERLRYMISMAAGLSEEMMQARADEPFPNPVTLQPFHIDGMVRLASSWRTISPTASHKMRETARRMPLESPRAVMDFVFDLFAEAVADTFWLDVFKLHYKPEQHANLVIDDVTTDAEKACVRELEGLMIGISRPGLESNLDGCDIVVANQGSETELQDQILAAVFGHLRGTPMPLASGDRAVVQTAPAVDTDAVKKVQEQAAKEHDALRKRLEEVQGGLEQQLAQRDLTISELKARVADGAAAKPAPTPSSPARPAPAQPAPTPAVVMDSSAVASLAKAEAEVIELRAQVSQLTAQVQRAAEARPATVVEVAAPVDESVYGPRETDTASLVARLALAMGYEAGLGKRNDGQPLICVDLPAGQISWSLTGATGNYTFLPRYDKAIEDVAEMERRQRLLNPNISVALTAERALEREESQLAVLSGFLTDLILLAEGCKVHRAYRAKRPPTGDCPTCWAMWEAGERLTQLTGVYSPDSLRPDSSDSD